MKIAYLITAFANFNHLNRLITSLEDNNVEFYIHIDKRSELPTNLLKTDNIHYISRIKVWWGGFSHMQAILDLMREALKNKPDYLVLISGGDYPIRSRAVLYNMLQSGGEYINIEKGFSQGKPEARLKYYYFDAFDRRSKSLKTKIYFLLEKIIRQIAVKKTYPFKEVYHGSTWWALSNSCATYMLEYLQENPKFLKFFKSSWCPEECMPHTIIGNSDFIKNVKYDLTYTDWSIKPGPALINENHIELFKKQKIFQGRSGAVEPVFARKFTDNSLEMIETIENELRNE